MRILHTVEFYHPSVGGAQEVVRRVSEGLAARGHEVTVATTQLDERTARVHNGVRIEEFSVGGNAVRGVKGEAERYQRFVMDGEFDVMMNYAAQQWATDLVFPLLNHLRFPAVLAPCGFSALPDPAYADYFAAMHDVLRSYDHLIFHSGTYQDTAFARTLGFSHYSVIPNGAAADEFGSPRGTFRRRFRIADDALLLLSVGSHTGLKGHATAIEAFRRARLKNAVLVVAGNVPDHPGGCYPRCRRLARRAWISSFARKRVLLLDLPRPEVVEAYHAADLFVFPSNVECSPVVLYEAMASRTPFVTTACGNAEEIVSWSGGGVVVATSRAPSGKVNCSATDLARALEELGHDPDRRAELANAGCNAWKERFTWESLIEQYEEVYLRTSVRGRETAVGSPLGRDVGQQLPDARNMETSA